MTESDGFVAYHYAVMHQCGWATQHSIFGDHVRSSVRRSQLSSTSQAFHLSCHTNTHTYAAPSLQTQMSLLPIQLRRCAPQPASYEKHPRRDRAPQSCNPWPRTSNRPTSWPLIVGEMSDCYLILLLNSGEEGSFVVDLESEYAMLVGCCEGGGVSGTIEAGGCSLQRKPYEGGEHAKFELKGV